eukprot:tig00000900_g5382.t1
MSACFLGPPAVPVGQRRCESTKGIICTAPLAKPVRKCHAPAPRAPGVQLQLECSSEPQASYSRRKAFAAAALAAAAAALRVDRPARAATDGLTLFEDAETQCSFQYPSDWEAGSKSGSLVFVKIPSGGRLGNAGLVVNPVKARALAEVGTAEEVARRTVAAEAKKDGVLSCELISFADVGPGRFYDVEYRVESTRGYKRVLSRAAIAGGRLYILNAQYPEADFAGEPEAQLRALLASLSVPQ